MARKSHARPRTRHKNPKKSGAGRVFLISAGMVVSALAGYAAGYFVDTGKSFSTLIQHGTDNENRDLLTRIEELKSRVQGMKAELSKQKQELKKPATEVGELTFYHELPKQSVTPEPVAETKVEPQKKKVKSKTIGQVISKEIQGQRQKKTAKQGTRYRLQVASFRAETDAAKLEKRLIAWGLNAFVKRANVPGHGWRYRVYTGPYADRKGVDKANLLVVKKLHRMGLILRVE